MESQATSIGNFYVGGLVALPAVLLAAGAMLNDAPGEWARNALMGYVALATMLVVGLALPQAGLWPLAALLVAFAAFIVGGPWGAIIAGLAAAGVAAAQLTTGPWPPHPALPIILALSGLAGGVRGLL